MSFTLTTYNNLTSILWNFSNQNQTRSRPNPIRPYIANTSISSNKIMDDAVITEKIADLAVTTEKLALGSVTNSRILSVNSSSILYSDEVDGLFQDINAKNIVVDKSLVCESLTTTNDAIISNTANPSIFLNEGETNKMKITHNSIANANYIQNLNAMPLIIDINAIEKLRIDDSGTLVNGTSSTTNLTVTQNAIINGTSSTTNLTVTQNAIINKINSDFEQDLTLGTTWVSKTSPLVEEYNWETITYGNKRFVAVSKDFGKVMISIDGNEWVIETGVLSNRWIAIAYGNEIFVAVAETGTQQIMYSLTNGKTWNVVTAPEGNVWRTIAYMEMVYLLQVQ